jgi:hypothetical protein
MWRKWFVVAALALAVCLAAAVVPGLLPAVGAVSDEAAAQVKGGAAGYCPQNTDWDPNNYCCGLPCAPDPSNYCPKVYGAMPGWTFYSDSLLYTQVICYTCTGGSYCGQCYLWIPVNPQCAYKSN